MQNVIPNTPQTYNRSMVVKLTEPINRPGYKNALERENALIDSNRLMFICSCAGLPVGFIIGFLVCLVGIWCGSIK